jgi:transposase InsO family protein
MGPSADAELVVALVMALGRSQPDADGLVHHSDKGGAYVSGNFCSMATVTGLQVSFGSTGDCYDNAAMDTFWSTLKREIAWIRGSIWFPTRDAARLYLLEFIEVLYNRQRTPSRSRSADPGGVRCHLQPMPTATPPQSGKPGELQSKCDVADRTAGGDESR